MQTLLCRDKEGTGCKASSRSLFISAFFLHLIIFSRVRAGWQVAFHLGLGKALRGPSNASDPEHTSLCSVAGQPGVFMQQNQKGGNVNKQPLLGQLLRIQSVLSIAAEGSAAALGVLQAADTKKSNSVNLNKINLFSCKLKGADATLPAADPSHKNRRVSLPPDRSLTQPEGVDGWDESYEVCRNCLC